ncbi:MAG: hypothetical protein IJS56_03805 [Bacilli bacterium]|nr:hypothetical protein [Bacilli bacterium]
MIKLNTVSVEKYSGLEREHRRVKDRLKEDVYTRRNISRDLDSYIEKLEDKSSEQKDNLIGMNVAYLNRESGNIPVGLIGIDKNDYRYSLVCSLLEEYRNQGIDLMLIQQYAYYLIDELGIDALYEDINKLDNEAVTNANIIGFTPITEETYVLKRNKR